MLRNQLTVMSGAVGIAIFTSQIAFAGFNPSKSWNFDDYTDGFVIAPTPTAADPFDDWKSAPGVSTYGDPVVKDIGTSAKSGTMSVLLAPSNKNSTNVMGLRFNGPGNAQNSRHGMDVTINVNFLAGTLVNQFDGNNVNQPNFEFYVTNLAATRAGKILIDAKADNTADIFWEHGDASKDKVLLTNMAVSALEGTWNKFQIRIDLDPLSSMTAALPADYDGSGDPSAYEVLINDTSYGVRQLYANSAIMPGGAQGNWVQDVFITTRMNTQVYVDDISVVAPSQLTVPEPASMAVLGLGAVGMMARRRRR